MSYCNVADIKGAFTPGLFSPVEPSPGGFTPMVSGMMSTQESNSDVGQAAASPGQQAPFKCTISWVKKRFIFIRMNSYCL